MKRSRLEIAFARILLLALPVGCGPHTTYEAAPPRRCGPDQFVAIPANLLSTDGGSSADGGGASSVLDPYVCASVCPGSFACELAAADGGSSQVRCVSQCPDGYTVGCGRRPAGLPPLAASRVGAVARYFEEAAYLEAASVHAFLRLAAELRSHGAPAELCAAAEAAAVEERRHTRAMAQLARRYGGAPRGPGRGPRHLRPLAELAAENAVEGCVRETYGALLAWLQAERADDPHVRRAFRTIAAEETEHARLAWSVARWLHSRLDRAARRAIASAQRAAVEQLQREVEAELPAALIQKVGLPTPALAGRLFAQARAALWS